MILLLTLVGCAGSTSVPTDPVPEDTGLPTVIGHGDPADSADTGPDTGAPPDDDAVFAAFYDPAVIQTVDLELTQAVIDQLNAGAEDYLPGNAIINGVRYDDVGVRLKGSSTYQDLDCADTICKAGFKIRLNEFEAGQTLGPIERVTLNNMTSDPTQSKEVIAYNLLARHSVLGSRCNFARVTLNGQPWGLYANLESADERWLERRFADTGGELWGTADYYGDFYTPYLDTGWVEKSGTGDRTQLEAVTAALDAYRGDFAGELGGVINVDQWLQYWAWCAAVGNYDGYPFTLNDVLIYADPSDAGRFVFAPWGMDESWDQVEVSGRTWNAVSGRLGSACLADTDCLVALKLAIRDAAQAYEADDVLGYAEAAWTLTEPDVLTDPKRPFTPQEVEAARRDEAGIIDGYADYVRGQL